MNHLEINITDDLNLSIKCLSTQTFPNGSAIFESFDRNAFTIETQDDSNDEQIESGLNITGLVIVCIIGLLIFLTIVLICYAQSKQILCYSTEEVTSPVVVVMGDNASSIPVTTELYIEETQQQDNQGQPQNDSIESFEPLGETEIPDIDEDEEKQGFLKSNDSQRLLELISSPPPILMPEDEDENPKLFRLSFSTSSNSLSEGLTVPSRQIKRRINDYVKVRPTSISATTTGAQEEEDAAISSASEAVTTAVIEHHETAL